MPSDPGSTGGSSSWNGCPTCGSLGRVEGLLCLACGGTGNRRAYRELAAYRLGLQHGIAAMRDAMPQYPPNMGLDDLQAALDANEQEAPCQIDPGR